MSAQHPNIVRIIRATEAFNRNDLDTFHQFFAEELIYRVTGRSPIAGIYHGVEQYAKLARVVREGSNNTIRIEPEVVVADEHTVMFTARITGQRNGIDLDSENVYYFRFRDDGKIIEGRTISTEQYEFDEFWAGT